MKITPENIQELKPNECFVFGSNLAGRHGKGAALLAKEKFGAVPGRGWGLMMPRAASYALPTKDENLKPLSLGEIGQNIALFEGFAKATPFREYLVTAIGCGLAGYQPEDIAPLFIGHEYVWSLGGLPVNMSLPESFWRVLIPANPS